jgi:hypothetical protein
MLSRRIFVRVRISGFNVLSPLSIESVCSYDRYVSLQYYEKRWTKFREISGIIASVLEMQRFKEHFGEDAGITGAIVSTFNGGLSLPAM